MNKTFIISDNIITPLGFTTSDNMRNILDNKSGINQITDGLLSPLKVQAAMVETKLLNSHFTNIGNPDKYTRFEKMALLSANKAISKTNIDVTSNKTLFILSTTKGNIDLLEDDNFKQFGQKRLYLWHTAQLLQKYFNNPNLPLVISNACISGVVAIILAHRLLQYGIYENIIITGCDIVSEFVVSGFLSFQALSEKPCRPFDKSRNGLNVGEGSGTIIMSSNPENINSKPQIYVEGGVSSNDANHISGPSRTGEGLYQAIMKTLNITGKKPSDINYLSAHGTATPYNDEMEAIAFNRSGLENVPVNSFKGYWGHTMGAAGIIESIAAIHSINNNMLYKSIGFENMGVTQKINIINQNKEKELKHCLKTASGFGGCNAAIILSKI